MRRGKRKSLNINRIRNKIDSKLANERKLVKEVFTGITIGTVVNTDDPQQMGRLQIFCPSLGDITDNDIKDLPWAIYATPFGGSVSFGNRGNDDYILNGISSYGLWAIPKVGAQVLVTSIEGNANYRIWIGCIYGQFLPHTMPNGRFFNKKDENGFIQNDFDGPLNSNESKLEPLYSNLEKAFGKKENNFEWKSRGMDNQVSKLDNIRLTETYSKVSDDDNRGYSLNRQLPEYNSKDSTIYSITTPGFHALSLDDKKENCRIKLRTTSGHMILMDDTNERIYIATAEGNNWIELDQAGNIDLYTKGNFSVHAEKDINLTSNKSIRMYSKEDLHIKSESKIKIQSDKDMHIKSNMNINTKALMNMDTHIVGNYKLQVDSKLDMLANSTLKINTNDTLYTRSSLNTYINGSQTYLNSGVGGNTVSPYSGNFVETSHGTSKVPEHEPWGRIAIKKDNAISESLYNTNILQGLGSKISDSILELSYSDENVGKIERNIQIKRGINWKR